jgi:hypothetical protein
MLRRTAERAFGPPEGAAAPAADPALPQSYRRATSRLHAELRDALAKARSPELPLLAVSGERALLEGVEFAAETEQCLLRFVDTQEGTIQVVEGAGESEVLREVLSVQLTADGYVPIRKPVRPGRSGFHWTSVRQLAARYLRALGVPNVDSS